MCVKVLRQTTSAMSSFTAACLSNISRDVYSEFSKRLRNINIYGKQRRIERKFDRENIYQIKQDKETTRQNVWANTDI